MTSEVQERANRAVHDCLATCYQSDNIVQTLAEFFSQLKAKAGWRRSEIRAVELAVLGVLHGVVHDAAYARDASEMAGF